MKVVPSPRLCLLAVLWRIAAIGIRAAATAESAPQRLLLIADGPQSARRSATRVADRAESTERAATGGRRSVSVARWIRSFPARALFPLLLLHDRSRPLSSRAFLFPSAPYAQYGSYGYTSTGTARSETRRYPRGALGGKTLPDESTGIRDGFYAGLAEEFGLRAGRSILP